MDATSNTQRERVSVTEAERLRAMSRNKRGEIKIPGSLSNFASACLGKLFVDILNSQKMKKKK